MSTRFGILSRHTALFAEVEALPSRPDPSSEGVEILSASSRHDPAATGSHFVVHPKIEIVSAAEIIALMQRGSSGVTRVSTASSANHNRKSDVFAAARKRASDEAAIMRGGEYAQRIAAAEAGRRAALVAEAEAETARLAAIVATPAPIPPTPSRSRVCVVALECHSHHIC